MSCVDGHIVWLHTKHKLTEWDIMELILEFGSDAHASEDEDISPQTDTDTDCETDDILDKLHIVVWQYTLLICHMCSPQVYRGSHWVRTNSGNLYYYSSTPCGIFMPLILKLYNGWWKGSNNTRVGTLIMGTIYLQLIQNRYMFRSFTVLQCSQQHCVQPVASDVEVVGYL